MGPTKSMKISKTRAK